MNKKQKEAYNFYMEHMKYTQISELTNVPVNTLKSWQKKYKWKREKITKNGVSNNEVAVWGNTHGCETYDDIRGGLLQQLIDKGMDTPYFRDLVNDYMKLWTVKNQLLDDVGKRGVQCKYKNGEKQFGYKKNDSVDSAIKYNSQMIAILDKLDLIHPTTSGADSYDDL